MPKVKTKKGITKRVKLTKKKKALRSKAGRRHLLSGKKRKRKRVLRKKGQVEAGFQKMVKKAVPYGA